MSESLLVPTLYLKVTSLLQCVCSVKDAPSPLDDSLEWDNKHERSAHDWNI